MANPFFGKVKRVLFIEHRRILLKIGSSLLRYSQQWLAILMTNQPERRFVMGRKANQARIKAAEKAIKTNSGHRAGHYASKLGYHRETFNRVLVQLHDRGVLLSEDERGRLWPFRGGKG